MDISNKKFSLSLLCMALVVFLLCGCSSGKTAESTEVEPVDSTGAAVSGEAVVSTEAAVKDDSIMFTTGTLPRIDGSLALVPFYEAAAGMTMGISADEAHNHVNFVNTDSAYTALVNGKRDVIFVTYPSEEEQAYAKEKGVELEIVPIINEGFVFFVNSNNPVDGLSLQQIKDIYSGKITNWSAVGGNNVAITPYQRRTNSGSQTGMLRLVMKDTPIMKAPSEYSIADMGGIIEAVAKYENEKEAIGYSYYYFVTDMYVKTGIKLLKINGVYPNQETISDMSYPICTNYYAVFNADEPEDSNTRKLVKWILSDEGQQLAEDVGYVKLSK